MIGTSQDDLGYVHLRDTAKNLIKNQNIPIIRDFVQKDAIIHYVHEGGLKLLKKFDGEFLL